MDARQLEYFLAVVDHGGFSRAAKAMFVAQPSLSQAIRALERDLGSELFHRIGRRVVLTGAGRALIAPARQVVRGLELARATVAAVQDLRSGRVEIAAMPSATVEPLSTVVRRFTGRHPGVSVRIRSAPRAHTVLEMVRTGTAEIGLLASRDAPRLDTVAVYPAGRHRLVLVTPGNGPFPAGTPVRYEQLAGHRLIVGEPGTGMRDLVEEIRAAGIEVTIVVESENREAFLPLVLGGVGLAVVADSWSRLAQRSGALVLDLEPAAHLEVAFVTRKAPLTPAAAAFLAAASAVTGAGDDATDARSLAAYVGSNAAVTSNDRRSL
ncbi:LysR family transcriptional regulator [Micromonospora sp. HM5-17]|jgi:DNA-binding transcriptional LysR family regulator|uniref:LysR family transcriptional regulator n=1 Tax=Micromonospora sp. HM5-17 TaxID=2487710 RepID=UPI000F46B011|nr:LysR family transcriptional regulator [Micromonospora sp. HM5-17]ROT33139.1 LysR family transcriptional regulator [Micromonospora sp. HM5-17]